MNVNATNQPEEIGPVAVALLAVELWDVEEALHALRLVIAPDTVVITLQNGVDAPQLVAAANWAWNSESHPCNNASTFGYMRMQRL